MSSFQTIIDNHFGKQPSASFKRGKRDAIFSAAAKLFAQHGFHKTETQKIADLAGVSNGTVFRYFESKDYLFWAITIWIGEKLEKRTQPIVESDADCITKIRKMATVWREFFSEKPEFVGIFVAQRAMYIGPVPHEFFQCTRKQFFIPFYEIILSGVNRGEIVVNNIMTSAYTLCEAISGAIMNYAYARNWMTLEEHMNNMLEPHLERLARTKPIQN